MDVYGYDTDEQVFFIGVDCRIGSDANIYTIAENKFVGFVDPDSGDLINTEYIVQSEVTRVDGTTDRFDQYDRPLRITDENGFVVLEYFYGTETSFVIEYDRDALGNPLGSTITYF